MQFWHSSTLQREFERSSRHRVTIEFHGPAKNYYRFLTAVTIIGARRVPPIVHTFS